MSRRTISRIMWALGCSVLVAAVSRPGTTAAGDAGTAQNNNAIDVAINAKSIHFSEPRGPNPADPTNDPGPHPYYGSSFVVQGVIYPRGTLDPDCTPVPEAGAYCGLLPDGAPEFPDKVIGRWYCRGWFVGEGGPNDVGGIFTPSGPFVVTTQIFDLDLQYPGAKTLISDGIELIDPKTPFQRAVIGGSGPYKHTRGDLTQTAIGTNSTGLFNLQFDFSIVPRRPLYQ
jgi:hypothetical protein